MLAGGSDQLYRDTLAAGHRPFVRIEVWSGSGIPLDTLIPEDLEGDQGGLVFLSGALTASLGSRVARNVQLEVPRSLYPLDESDLLWYGNELRIFRGIALVGGSEKYVWQVFRGRIRDLEQDSSSGTCTVTCADRASDVLDAGFVSPQNSNPANGINAEWQRLIIDAVPDATFGASDTFTIPVKPMTWEFDRGAACDEMARSAGALWYPLANGDYVIRRLPWTVQSPLVFTLTDQPGGTINRFRSRRSRDSIYNVVTVAGERLNGDAPVFATASDTTVGSPTNISGPFGVRSRLERLQTPGTTGGAQTTANALLRAYVSPTEEFSLDVVPDAALELGDAGIVAVDGREVVQVVTAFTLPLGLAGDMTVSTRSLVVGGV